MRPCERAAFPWKYISLEEISCCCIFFFFFSLTLLSFFFFLKFSSVPFFFYCALLTNNKVTSTHRRHAGVQICFLLLFFSYYFCNAGWVAGTSSSQCMLLPNRSEMAEQGVQGRRIPHRFLLTTPSQHLSSIRTGFPASFEALDDPAW